MWNLCQYWAWLFQHQIVEKMSFDLVASNIQLSSHSEAPIFYHWAWPIPSSDRAASKMAWNFPDFSTIWNRNPLHWLQLNQFRIVEQNGFKMSRLLHKCWNLLHGMWLIQIKVVELQCYCDFVAVRKLVILMCSPPCRFSDILPALISTREKEEKWRAAS